MGGGGSVSGTMGGGTETTKTDMKRWTPEQQKLARTFMTDYLQPRVGHGIEGYGGILPGTSGPGAAQQKVFAAAEGWTPFGGADTMDERVSERLGTRRKLMQPTWEKEDALLKEQAFKMGANNSQADSAVDALLSLVADQTETTNKALNEQTEANINALKTEFGDGYDAINDGIVAMLEDNGMTSEQATFFKDSGVLSEPSLAIPLAKIAAQFADDPEIGHHQTSTQSGLQDQIADVEGEMQRLVKSGEPIPKRMLEKRNSLYSKLK